MLVAPATLGLLAPMSATANEVTINDFNAAEEIAVQMARQLRSQINELAGGFSDTTTLDGKVALYRCVKADDSFSTGNGEALMVAYSYKANLNTSLQG